MNSPFFIKRNLNFYDVILWLFDKVVTTVRDAAHSAKVNSKTVTDRIWKAAVMDHPTFRRI